MTTLVAPSDVRSVLEVPPDASDGMLQYFINAADLVVTEQLIPAVAASGQPVMSAARLFNIELFMSCHFAQMLTERGGLTSSRTGESADTYQKSTGTGFLATRYGSQAVLLDTSGTLKAMSSTALTAIFGVYGSAQAIYATTGLCPPWIDPDSNRTIPGYFG